MNGNKVYLSAPVIISKVAECLNVTPENIVCSSRKRELIKAKHIAMYCCRKFTDLSQREVGIIFNGKDHATVCHAEQSVSGQSDIYRAYRIELNKILSALNMIADVEFDKYQNYETDKA